MIYSIVKLGLVPVWFNVAPDCSIDLCDLQRRFGLRKKAVIAVHYFGFPTPLAAPRQLCNAHGVSVARLEEFFWDEQDRMQGSVADTYSKSCMQLPIHQSVTYGDLDFIVSILAQS